MAIPTGLSPGATARALAAIDPDIALMSDEEARVLAQRNAYDAAQKQFATGDFDMGSLAAQSALPINRSRPDLWQNEVILNQPDPEGSFTGVSLDDTYAAHRAGDLEGVLPTPFPANLAYYGGRIANPGYEPPIESTGLLEGIAARKFFEPDEPIYGGSFVKSLVDQGKVTPEAGQEYIDRINTIQVDKEGDLRADVVYGALDPADPGAAGTAGKPTEAIINDVLTNWGNVGEANIKIVPTDTPVSQALQGIFPGGAPTSLMEPAQPPRSLPIGTPGWQPTLGLEAELTYQYDPMQLGLDPSQFTSERVGASSNFLSNLLSFGSEAQKTAIQRAFSPATAGFLRENLAAHYAQDDSPFMVDPSTGEPFQLAQVLKAPQARELGPTPSRTEFEGYGMRDVRFPYPETGFQGIPAPEPTAEPSPFIGDEGFTPSLPATTLGGPVVGETEQPEEVADVVGDEGAVETVTKEPVTKERVKKIKNKPRETRTPVEEQVLVASEVQNALANAAKGKPVQKNLQALVDLAQIDPTIVERYTTPGSQDLIDITSQVESFAGIEPKVEWDKVVRKATKGFEKTATQKGLQAQAATERRLAKEAREKKAADREAAKIEAAKTREEKQAEAAAIREERKETRLANQAANKKLLAEKKEARDIQKAENAAIRAEKLAARESAKQTRDRKAAEQALAVQRQHEKMARVEELKRHEQMLRFADESRKAYLARKKQEDELREAQGYGWGGMFT